MDDITLKTSDISSMYDQWGSKHWDLQEHCLYYCSTAVFNVDGPKIISIIIGYLSSQTFTNDTLMVPPLDMPERLNVRKHCKWNSSLTSLLHGNKIQGFSLCHRLATVWVWCRWAKNFRVGKRMWLLVTAEDPIGTVVIMTHPFVNNV